MSILVNSEIKLSTNTVADSKKAFHMAFPYVIPGIYRRVTDELIVELNLLSHQDSFSADELFSLGLTEVFDSFTAGYEPEVHAEKLFEAICTCNGFNAKDIRDNANKLINEIKKTDKADFMDWLAKTGESDISSSIKSLDKIANPKRHYSRITSIGLLKILSELDLEEKILKDEKLMKILSEVFAINKERAEKDIGTFKNGIDKINQAIELIKESIEREKKKQTSDK